MPIATHKKHERITVSLPAEVARAIDAVKDELHLSKSEVMKLAFESFIKEHRKEQVKKVAEMMAVEYAKGKKLTEFTALDSEDFA